MKQIFKTISAVALVALAAACQKDNLGEAVPAGQKVDVNLTLTSPQIGTKAVYADGTTVNTVHVYVYQQGADGTSLTYIAPAADGAAATPTQEVEMKNGTAKYSTRLVTGQKYTFVFWADRHDKGKTSPYTYDSATQTVTVSYADAAGNDESRDAFYNILKDVEIKGAYTSDVKLYRPFAQINFGASDLADAKAANLDVTKVAVKLTKAATSLNLLTGDVEGEADVTFAETALAGGKLTVSNVDYDYLTMDYVLVGKNVKTLSDVTLTANAGAWTYTYSNVPLQGNYRTNIVGKLFTSSSELSITVEPGFNEPANDIDLENISTETALKALFAKGGSAKLAGNIELNEAVTLTGNKTVTLDLNGKSIINNKHTERGGGYYTEVFKVGDDAVLNIKGNGDIKAIADDANDGYRIAVWAYGNAKVNISGGNFYNKQEYNATANLIYAMNNAEISIAGGRFETANLNSEGSSLLLNLNDADRATAKIVVTGGEFVNFDPANNKSEGANTNFCADGYTSVTTSANPLIRKVVKATKAETEDAIESSLNVAGTGTIVSKDVSVATISVNKKSILKLVNNAVVSGNGGPAGKHNDAIQVGSGSNLSIEGEGTIKACTIPSSQTPAINVINGGVVNIYDGVTVDGGSGSKGNYAIKLVSGTANIYGGYFCSGVNADGSSSEVIYLYSMKTWQFCAKTALNIYGGVFEHNGGSSTYLINCYDKPYKEGYCSVKIMGGTFVGFNPADNSAEGEHTNFVADGYKSVETTYNGKQAWEVVPE